MLTRSYQLPNPHSTFTTVINERKVWLVFFRHGLEGNKTNEGHEVGYWWYANVLWTTICSVIQRWLKTPQWIEADYALGFDRKGSWNFNSLGLSHDVCHVLWELSRELQTHSVITTKRFNKFYSISTFKQRTRLALESKNLETPVRFVYTRRMHTVFMYGCKR